MKGKVSTIVLISVVMIIWGLLVKEIYDTYFSDSYKIDQTIVSQVVENKLVNTTPRTYVVSGSFLDPFLKNQSFENEKWNSSIRTKAMKRKVDQVILTTQPTVLWPAISFMGGFKNKSTRKVKGILVINNKEYVVSIGSLIEDVKVLGIGVEFIKLNFSGTNKEFHLNK